jgi:butyrate kinase
VTAATVLVINPGSTSTRVALFQGETCLAEKYLACEAAELARCETMNDQIPLREKHVRDFLHECGREVSALDAIAARGGPLRPVSGGVYQINDALLADAKGTDFIQHVSRIACVIADDLAREAGIPAFIVDPVSTDEYEDISRISGCKNLPRKSLIHALNLRAVARLYAKELGRPYEEMNLITVQLGGGCSIAIHKQGRMVDSVDANGEGPFSPERCGALRADDLAKFTLNSGLNASALRMALCREAGLKDHLGTTDAREVEKMIDNGDANAKLVYEAMAYNIAKHICALSAAVNGKVDGILLAGGMAKSKMFARWIEERVSFLAPVKCYPDEQEMSALRDGVLRVLSGKEKAKVYPTGESV